MISKSVAIGLRFSPASQKRASCISRKSPQYLFRAFSRTFIHIPSSLSLFLCLVYPLSPFSPLSPSLRALVEAALVAKDTVVCGFRNENMAWCLAVWRGWGGHELELFYQSYEELGRLETNMRKRR